MMKFKKLYNPTKWRNLADVVKNQLPAEQKPATDVETGKPNSVAQ